MAYEGSIHGHPAADMNENMKFNSIDSLNSKFGPKKLHFLQQTW